MGIDQKLLTPRDVANMLGCSPDQVIQLARAGKIPVAGTGRFWRFHPADVIAYREQMGLSGSQKK